jgi:hypothetical protein
LIIFFGTLFSLALGASWVIAKQRWNQVDLHDPRKDLASEVFHTVNSHMPWATPNGSRFQAASHQLWIKLAGKSRNGVQD